MQTSSTNIFRNRLKLWIREKCWFLVEGLSWYYQYSWVYLETQLNNINKLSDIRHSRQSTKYGKIFRDDGMKVSNNWPLRQYNCIMFLTFI